MLPPPNNNPAFGTPIDPAWTRSDKDGVGTAANALSNLWFTVAKGVVTEVYYPTIDLPQIRDLQYITTDGATFFHDERRNFDNVHQNLAAGALGYTITNTSQPTPGGQVYRIIKQVISVPESPCLLIYTTLDVPAPLRGNLKLFALLAPHLDGSGWQNSGWIAESPFGKVLVAQSQHGRGTWLAMAATVRFLQCSSGIVGVTDGWQDLNGSAVPGNRPFVMDWSFDSALNSNIALTGQLDVSTADEFVLGLAFGETLNSAVQRLWQGLSYPFQLRPADPPDRYNHLQSFLKGWSDAQAGAIVPAAGVTGDADQLYFTSRAILMAHEDKTYNGALIASLSIPWGDSSNDANMGYHLVWTRDMCNSATALLASGEKDTALRALVFLATVQRGDGAFYQNFYVDGSPHWTGVQLDEISFPIMLAWRLDHAGVLQNFDPYPMVRRAAIALSVNGPMTQQERWEENEGYSPSTLAACIAAMICAANFASRNGEAGLATFFTDYADFLESHLEVWTVANTGQFLPNVRHFVRILPTFVKGDGSRAGPLNVPAKPASDGDPDVAVVTVGNHPPDGLQIAARDLIDPGFLELVRYGVRAADDPLVVDSLRVVDAQATGVRVDFAGPRSGPGWHRYNQDGYGNAADGAPFNGAGRGGTWPLLTGERGHYALAAGNDARPFLRAMENFSEAGLLTEQLWDLPDLPAAHMQYSFPSGAAMPLAWAHAEYIKLVRSVSDGAVFDLMPDVASRYRDSPRRGIRLEVWNFYRQIDTIARSVVLRIIFPWRFQLHYSNDRWATTRDVDATSLAAGLFHVDLQPLTQPGAWVFTFFWLDLQQWQQVDYRVAVA